VSGNPHQGEVTTGAVSETPRVGLNDTFRKRVPTLTMASMTGINSLPRQDNEYSTDGGEVGVAARSITPFSSSLRSRAVSIFGEIRAMSLSNSQKRRAPPLKCQMTSGVHAPLKSFMHSCMGQPAGGGGAELLRIFRPIRLNLSRQKGSHI